MSVRRARRQNCAPRRGTATWNAFATGLLVTRVACGCEPEVVVGTWACANTNNASNSVSDGGASDAAPVVTTPWLSDFEDGFCGYAAPGGFCYAFSGASYTLVTSPVHSGRFAAAFAVDNKVSTGAQARCVREGVLPRAAYYGAWYFVPSPQANGGNWNLFHFQGGRARGARLHGLWDLSLVNDKTGALRLSILDFLGGIHHGASGAPPIPIGSWFHLQFYLRRAADATGEVTVYQDGVVAFHLVDLITDDSSYARWYVGNLATALMPAESTIYVDDIEISDTR